LTTIAAIGPNTGAGAAKSCFDLNVTASACLTRNRVAT